MNINKRVLSFLLAIMMILTLAPTFTVGAVEAVDLIHDAGGNIKEGVYMTYEGGMYEYGGTHPAHYAIDNNTTAWWSSWEPTQNPWMQINFPAANRITEIKIEIDLNTYWDNPFEVLVSNTKDFSEFETVFEQAGSYGTPVFTIDDSSIPDTAYQYVRVVNTGSSAAAGNRKNMSIKELDIKGVESSLPDVSGDDVLTDAPDVFATSSHAVATADNVAENVLDNNTSTFYCVNGVDKPDLTIDLRRKAEISKISLKMVDGAEYVASRTNYEIQLSDVPNFATYDVAYIRAGSEASFQETVSCYNVESRQYRYVRIKSTADASQLAISEVKVWGTEAGDLAVTDLAQTATVTATTDADKGNLTDGDISTGWIAGDGTQKEAITYEFDVAKLVTSFQIFPVFDSADDTLRKNFRVLGSANGTFDDSDVLLSGVTLQNGIYNSFTIDDIKEYKAIRFESTQDMTPASGFGFKEIRIISDNSDTSVLVASTVPGDGATGVSNLGNFPTYLIEVELNRTINVSTINPDNIEIKNVTDNKVLQSWTPYDIDGKKFRIDASILDSNKEYEITLSTGVKTGALPLTEETKFSFTTGAIIKVPYVPGKVLVNVLKNKLVTGNRYAPTGPLSNIVDDNESTQALSDPDTGGPKIQIDLGNVYEIVAVELTPNVGSSSNETLLQDMYVVGGKTDLNIAAMTAEKAEAQKLAIYPSDSVVKETMALQTPKKIRYLGLYRANTYAVINEVRAYAYVDEDFAQWSVTRSDSPVTEVTVPGVYKFSIPVFNNTDESATYYMTVFAYNADGKMTYKGNCGIVTAAANTTTTLFKTISVSSLTDVDEITAVLYKSRGTQNGGAKVVVDAKTIYKTAPTPITGVTEPAATNLSNAVNFTTDDSGFKITGKVNNQGYIKDTDRIAVQVLAPSSGVAYNFANIPTGFDVNLCYSKSYGMLSNGDSFEFKFKADNAPDAIGKYMIRISLTKEDGTVELAEKSFMNLNDAARNNCINAFKAYVASDVDATAKADIEALFNTWVTTNEYMQESQFVGLDVTDVPDRFGKMFEYLCDVYGDGMASMSDLVDCINAAYIVSLFEEGDTASINSAKAALNAYTGTMGGLYVKQALVDGVMTAQPDASINFDRFATVYTALKSNINSKETFEDVFKWSKALSFIQDATRENIKFAIEKYNTILDDPDSQGAFDFVTYASTRNVTLDEAAMKIGTTNASSYYHDFEQTYKNAVQAVIDGRSGGAPSGGAVVAPGIQAPIRVPNAPVGDTEGGNEGQITPPVIENAHPFADSKNIEWAAKHIEKLYARGIVNGGGDGNFHPERQVSREEFLKMLIEAFDIDVASKESTEFEDCSPDAWYYSYVQIASTNKITRGLDRQTFGIGRSITRQDMAVMLSKALAIKNVFAQESESVFVDEASISEYALSEVSKMCSLGIISGFEDGTFAPKAYTTRAQAAVIISRALDILEGVSE